MIGEELVPGLPATRRPDECPFGDVEAVSAELVVSPVRRLVVRKYERAEGPAPAVVARVLKVGAGELGAGASPGDVVVLYSESLGDAGGFRRLLGRGRRARFRALVETPRLVRAVPDVREFGGHLVELRPERSMGPVRGNQLIGVGGISDHAPREWRAGL
jgi:hypothetical protein